MQQLDFESLMSDTREQFDAQQPSVGLDSLCRLVSVNLFGHVERLARYWDPGSAQTEIQRSQVDLFDVRYCALCVATAIITRSSRAFFEQRGLDHLSMLLREFREAPSASEMRKVSLLVSWRRSLYSRAISKYFT